MTKLGLSCFRVNVIKMLLPLRQTINIFLKILRFFTTSFNPANDVYVTIYDTAQLTMFYVFKSKNKHPRFICKCVGCIFNSFGLIITHEIHCMYLIFIKLVKKSHTKFAFVRFFLTNKMSDCDIACIPQNCGNLHKN
jgi:hypothetical protein